MNIAGWVVVNITFIQEVRVLMGDSMDGGGEGV